MSCYLNTGTQRLVLVAIFLLATVALGATLKSTATIDMPEGHLGQNRPRRKRAKLRSTKRKKRLKLATFA
jgi:hypothetical protein